MIVHAAVSKLAGRAFVIKDNVVKLLDSGVDSSFEDLPTLHDPDFKRYFMFLDGIEFLESIDLEEVRRLIN